MATVLEVCNVLSPCYADWEKDAQGYNCIPKLINGFQPRILTQD